MHNPLLKLHKTCCNKTTTKQRSNDDRKSACTFRSRWVTRILKKQEKQIKEADKIELTAGVSEMRRRQTNFPTKKDRLCKLVCSNGKDAITKTKVKSTAKFAKNEGDRLSGSRKPAKNEAPERQHFTVIVNYKKLHDVW